MEVCSVIEWRRIYTYDGEICSTLFQIRIQYENEINYYIAAGVLPFYYEL